mgnify:CR=1 FL=1
MGKGSIFRTSFDVTSYIGKFNAAARSGLSSSTTTTQMYKNFIGMTDDTAKLEYVFKNPGNYTNVLKNIDDGTLKSLYGGMTDAARTDFLRKVDPDIKKKLDLDPVTTKVADDVDVRFPDGTTKSVKYGSTGFWNAVSNGATVLGGLALLTWIDKKFEEAEEEYKNCMVGCLPHNWDEYDSGTLKKSELKYSTVETLREKGLEPIENQPYCKKNIKDCGKFCDEKCEKETDVDLPGSNALGGIFDKLRRTITSFLPDIPGVDPTMISFASSASSVMMFMLIIMQFAV